MLFHILYLSLSLGKKIREGCVWRGGGGGGGGGGGETAN